MDTVYTPLLLGPDEHLLTQGILGVRCLDPSTYSPDFCIPTKNKLVKLQLVPQSASFSHKRWLQHPETWQKANPRYAKNTNGWPTSANKICVQTCESGQLGSWRMGNTESSHWKYIYSCTRFCPSELGVGIRGAVNLGATVQLERHVIRWDRVIRLTRWGIEAALWASKDSRTAPFPQFPNISSKLEETSDEILSERSNLQVFLLLSCFVWVGKFQFLLLIWRLCWSKSLITKNKYTKIMSVLGHCFSNITGFLNLWSQRRVATNQWSKLAKRAP